MSFITIVGPTTEFVGADGKKYTLTPLGFAEVGEYLLWFQYKPLEDFKKGPAKGLSPELRLEKEREIFDECRKRTPPAPESAEIINSYMTVAGMGKQLYLSLRILSPNLEEAYVSRIINEGNITEVFAKLQMICGILPEKKDEDEDNSAGEL